MKKNKVTKVTNLIILDASGSMMSKTSEVRGGLKTILDQIKSDANKDVEKAQVATIVTDFASHGDFQIVVNEKDSIHFVFVGLPELQGRHHHRNCYGDERAYH